MKQTLHIFAKDTRRLWPEILISVVVSAAFVLIFPSQWRVYEDPAARNPLMPLLLAFTLLVPASWWLLVARVVHDETLVGDNQFWITRPYEWKKLLAAKVLFLATWIAVPFLLGQFLLLAEAGFHPLSYVSVVLFDLFIASGMLIVPLFAIAAVTSNFARMTLALLGGILAILLLAFGIVSIFGRGYSTYNPYQNNWMLPLEFFGGLVAITLQYAMRRVWLMRGVMIAIAVILFALTVGYRFPTQGVIDRAYPQMSAASTPPVQVALALDARHVVESRLSDGEDYIGVPVEYSGIAAGSAVFAEDFRFTLTAANGDQWTSPWEQITRQNEPGTANGKTELSLPMSPAVFERFQSAPMTLRVSFAVARLQADTVTKMTFPAEDVAVPGIGFCMPRSRQYSDNLNCRSVQRQARLTRATTIWTKGSCTDAPAPENTSEGATWVESLNPSTDFVLNSVWSYNIFFSNHRADNGPEDEAQHWRVCRGAPLTLTQYHLVDRERVEMTIPNFQIPAIARAGSGN